MSRRAALIFFGVHSVFGAACAQAQALDFNRAQERYANAVALCRTSPVTAQTRNSGRTQLEELRSNVLAEMRRSIAASAPSSKLGQLASKIEDELEICVAITDLTSFGSLGWKSGNSGGKAGAGGTVHVANGEDGPGGPGTRGTLYEVDPTTLQFKDTSTTLGASRATQMLDLQIKQLDTQKQILQLHRDGVSKGGLSK
ncbi:UNVERIFIED_ORG: hypothetical protein ABIC43_004911 [Variovorax guangxiensis]|jgi:hypothetical protein